MIERWGEPNARNKFLAQTIKKAFGLRHSKSLTKEIEQAINFNALINNQLQGLVQYSLNPDKKTIKKVNKHLSEIYGLLGGLDAWSQKD